MDKHSWYCVEQWACHHRRIDHQPHNVRTKIHSVKPCDHDHQGKFVLHLEKLRDSISGREVPPSNALRGKTVVVRFYFRWGSAPCNALKGKTGTSAERQWYEPDKDQARLALALPWTPDRQRRQEFQQVMWKKGPENQHLKENFYRHSSSPAKCTRRAAVKRRGCMDGEVLFIYGEAW